MEEFLSFAEISPTSLKILNTCRLVLQKFMLANNVTRDGTKMSHAAWTGQKVLPHFAMTKTGHNDHNLPTMNR